LQKAPGVGLGDVIVDLFIGEQGGVGPDRVAVVAPEAGQRPARQLLARIPLALAVVQQAGGRVARLEFVQQGGRERALVRPAHRGGVPFLALAVVYRDKGGFAAHGQAHVLGREVAFDAAAQGLDAGPLLVGIGQRDARRFEHPGDAHFMLELGLAGVGGAGHRRGVAGVGGAGQGDMPFAGEQARSRVQADPAGARQVDLAPGVQVGEVGFRAGRTVQRFDVGLELDQVAGDKARGHAEVAQHLHQQPGGVAARAAGVDQGLLRGLHSGLHADQVAHVVLHALDQGHQEVDGRHRFARHRVEVLLEQRRGRELEQVGRQFVLQRFIVLEGDFLGIGLEKEVERVDHRHLGDQVDLDFQFLGLFREHQARQVVALRILLPVDEMVGRGDRQRIGEDGGARMRRRAQAHDLRADADQAVIAVVGDVAQGNVDGQGKLLVLRRSFTYYEQVVCTLYYTLGCGKTALL
jgi:hypothetical protein